MHEIITKSIAFVVVPWICFFVHKFHGFLHALAKLNDIQCVTVGMLCGNEVVATSGTPALDIF